jgi:dipeptidyl aminopeptidase/acylaminoacyl peptidase
MRRFSIPLLAGFALSAIASAAHAVPERRFTVTDSIGLSTFLYPSSNEALVSPRAMVSPDGKRFVVVSVRGDLASGKRESTLWLFERDAVQTYLAGSASGDFDGAKPLLRFASATNHGSLSDLGPVSDWRWSEDARSLLFLGADDDGARRLYRIGVDGGEPFALSRADQDVNQYDERNGAIVYLAHAPVRANDLYQAGGPSLPDMEIATGKNVVPLVFPNWADAYFKTSDDELWKIDNGQPVAVPGKDGKPIRFKNSNLSLAPDGRHLIVTRQVPHIPKSWERYRASRGDFPGWRIVADTPETEGSTDFFRPKQYVLVDMATGDASPLVDAPIERDGLWMNRVFARWTADSRQVALVAAYPVIDPKSTATEPVLPCALGTIDVSRKRFRCAQAADAKKQPFRERRQLTDMQWHNGDRELVAEYMTPNAPNEKIVVAFSRAGERWNRREMPASVEPLRLDVHEALDEPPLLMGRLQDKTEKRLLDPNPQLKGIALGNAAVYEWNDAAGRRWAGVLVTPPDLSKDRRYPLVIQTHGFDKRHFFVDGPSATGFAARAFAARDIVVLQVQEIDADSDTPKEASTGAAGYRAAIKQLVSEGVVDAAKVGIIPWSHYGPHAMQALIEEPGAYAAATWAEAAFNTYGEYLMNIDYMGKGREEMYRAQFGAKPFGEGLKLALANSPGFHTEAVCTPILFQVNDPASLIYVWDAYATLRAQNKPIELFYIRNGDHELVRPKQRLAEQGMNVDWYDYWLNGRKDADPAKADQYRRWDALKAMPRCGDAKVDIKPGS